MAIDIENLEENFFKTVIFDSPDCVKILDHDARLVFMNVNGMAALCIRSFADVEGLDWRTFWADPFRQKASRAVEQAKAGNIGHFIGRYDVEGAERWWDVSVMAMPGLEHQDRLFAVSRDITAEHLLGEVEARMRGRIERHLRAINEASDVLSASLDFDTTLASLADVVVNDFAAICVLETFEALAQPVVRARAEIDSALVDVIRDELTSVRLTSLTQNALETGKPQLETSISEASFATLGTSPEITRVFRQIGVSALLTVPILHHGVVSGSMTLVADRSKPQPHLSAFDQADILFVEELGRRAGLALFNARSYGREHAIAARMQKAALPDSLPSLENLILSAAYRPSSDEALIGGDWYDAFRLRDGRVAITIGDVEGHGLAAAVVMMKLRQTMRAAALSTYSPVDILTIADESLRIEGVDQLATAVAAIFDPRTGRLEFAGAGHPGPFLRLENGTIEDLTENSPMLGLGMRYVAARTITLAPKSILAFFTDGLVDFDRNILHGLERIETALAALEFTEGHGAAARLVDAVVADNTTRDDVAVLVAMVSDVASASTDM